MIAIKNQTEIDLMSKACKIVKDTLFFLKNLSNLLIFFNLVLKYFWGFFIFL